MRPLRRPGRRGRDRGSMAVEFVIAAPALVLLLLLVSAGGQWLNLTGDVSAAARDAVRAASIARTFDAAQQDAQTQANTDLNGVCSNAAPAVNLQLIQGGTPVGPGAFGTAQEVRVTVSCVASLQVFRTIGFPVSQTFTDTAAAPLDPFVDRG